MARGVNNQPSPPKKSDFTNLQRNKPAGIPDLNPQHLLAKSSKTAAGVKGGSQQPSATSMDVKDLGVVSGAGKENNGKRRGGGMNQLDASDSQILIGGPTKEDSF